MFDDQTEEYPVHDTDFEDRAENVKRVRAILNQVVRAHDERARRAGLIMDETER